MIDKFRSDAAATVGAIPSGATLAVGGFGSSGRPDTLLDALCDLDRRDLHVIVNNVGGDFTGIGRLLLEHRIRRLTASFPVLPEFYDEYFAGRVVTRVYTDLAVFHIVDGELRLTEYAPGVTPAEVRKRTGAPYVEDLNPEG